MGFPENFLWGAASSAHQIEGAALEDGKSEGIWDAMAEGMVAHGDRADISCDHYHRFREDIALMKALGLRSYRFSVSWPRVIPQRGAVNMKGLEFYISLARELRLAGIEPICTLFHWNMPMWAQELGGWLSPEMQSEFAFFTKTVVEAISEYVRYWITLNEPQCFIGSGYKNGQHPPFLKEKEKIPEISRNVMLSHGAAVRAIREAAKTPPLVGFSPTGGVFTPLGGRPEDIETARRKSYEDWPGVYGNIWWSDPMVLGKIPPGLEGTLTPEDMGLICEKLDFYAFNIYNSTNFIEKNGKNPYAYPGMPRSAMGWPITPEVMYWAAKFHYERYGLPILISENGYAGYDFIMRDGRVRDPQRADFIKSYLIQLRRAADERIPVIGYQYWSIFDNYEWLEGYDKRFGLVFIDYRTGKRILKDSALEYAEIIRTNGRSLAEKYGA